MLNIFPDDFNDGSSSYQYQEPGVSSPDPGYGGGLHSGHGLHGPGAGPGLTRGPLVQDLVQQNRPFTRPVRWAGGICNRLNIHVFNVVQCNVAVQCSVVCQVYLDDF